MNRLDIIKRYELKINHTDRAALKAELRIGVSDFADRRSIVDAVETGNFTQALVKRIDKARGYKEVTKEQSTTPNNGNDMTLSKSDFSALSLSDKFQSIGQDSDKFESPYLALVRNNESVLTANDRSELKANHVATKDDPTMREFITGILHFIPELIPGDIISLSLRVRNALRSANISDLDQDAICTEGSLNRFSEVAQTVIRGLVFEYLTERFADNFGDVNDGIAAIINEGLWLDDVQFFQFIECRDPSPFAVKHNNSLKGCFMAALEKGRVIKGYSYDAGLIYDVEAFYAAIVRLEAVSIMKDEQGGSVAA